MGTGTPPLVAELADLPVGGHAVSFHADEREAARNAASFLAGAPEGQGASFWISDPSLLPYYVDELVARAPAQVGCVQILDGPQVAPTGPGEDLRPVPEVRSFVEAHPEGVTAGAGTISLYWTPEALPDYLEYEAWFDAQERSRSRFLCPYDLRRIPPERAPLAMRALARHHSHLALSQSPELAPQLLQVFLFEDLRALPPTPKETFDWALSRGFVEMPPGAAEPRLTWAGIEFIRSWEESAEGRDPPPGKRRRASARGSPHASSFWPEIQYADA